MTGDQRAGNARSAAVAIAACGLAVLVLFSMTLAAAQAALPAPASPTTSAFFPIIYAPVPPTPTGTPPPVTPPAVSDWQTVLSYYRASARLPTLAYNTGWSAGAALHARYMVKNQVLANTEDPTNPDYSIPGATEAANSNLMLSDRLSTTDQQALDFWMAKPFHALGLLDPGLLSTGFGSYREDLVPYKMGAVVDVRQGLGAIPGSVRFPVKWPDINTTVYLAAYDGHEQPDPLTSCPGYAPPSGLPIILQMGAGGDALSVTAHSFKQAGTNLAHCVFDASDYTNAIDAGLQILGRQILAASDAVVLIPQQPLTPGQSYTASITVNSQIVTWTFHVAP